MEFVAHPGNDAPDNEDPRHDQKARHQHVNRIFDEIERPRDDIMRAPARALQRVAGVLSGHSRTVFIVDERWTVKELDRSAEAPLQQGPLGRIGGQLERSGECRSALGDAAEIPEQLGARRVEEVVVIQHLL